MVCFLRQLEVVLFVWGPLSHSICSYFRFRLLLAPGQGQSDIASPPAAELTLGTNPVISFHMFAFHSETCRS